MQKILTKIINSVLIFCSCYPQINLNIHYLLESETHEHKIQNDVHCSTSNSTNVLSHLDLYPLTMCLIFWWKWFFCFLFSFSDILVYNHLIWVELTNKHLPAPHHSWTWHLLGRVQLLLSPHRKLGVWTNVCSLYLWHHLRV